MLCFVVASIEARQATNGTEEVSLSILFGKLIRNILLSQHDRFEKMNGAIGNANAQTLYFCGTFREARRNFRSHHQVSLPHLI